VSIQTFNSSANTSRLHEVFDNTGYNLTEDLYNVTTAAGTVQISESLNVTDSDTIATFNRVDVNGTTRHEVLNITAAQVSNTTTVIFTDSTGTIHTDHYVDLNRETCPVTPPPTVGNDPNFSMPAV